MRVESREEHIEYEFASECAGSELACIVGFNVERLRTRAGVSKLRFSKMLGIGRPTLDLIERGKGNPRLTLLVKLAEALEVTVVDLVTMPPHLSDANARLILTQKEKQRNSKKDRRYRCNRL